MIQCRQHDKEYCCPGKKCCFNACFLMGELEVPIELNSPIKRNSSIKRIWSGYDCSSLDF